MTEQLATDVIVVGGGPAGLGFAIAMAKHSDQEVYLLEKGQSVGNHLISGSVIDPSALDQLLPEWREEFVEKELVTKDLFYYFTEKQSFRLPHLPKSSQKNCFVLSLSKLCRYLAQKAEQLGVQILNGYNASDVIIENDRVVGIKTGDFGILKNGQKGENFQEGMEIRATTTVIAEGAYGYLAEQLIKRYQLRTQPMTYGLGVKEVWRVKKESHYPGKVVHVLGWPLPKDTYGGGFIYHGPDQKVFIGLIVGLDAPNPTLSPFQELQQFKHHPMLSQTLSGGEPIAYGARVINEGGYQSIPKLDFPGGVLIGCAAGFVNIVRIKGVHAAIHSGIEAAHSIIGKQSYDQRFKSHAVVKDLYLSRNVRPAFKKGFWAGLLHTGLDQYIFRGRLPYTFNIYPDHQFVNATQDPIIYPKPDMSISYDLLSMLRLAHVKHREDQPPHLVLKDDSLAISINYKLYHSPETHYCPAQVYEVINEQFYINATNCIHCKACAIRDPNLNIEWRLPEAGGGPNYSET